MVIVAGCGARCRSSDVLDVCMDGMVMVVDCGARCWCCAVAKAVATGKKVEAGAHVPSPPTSMSKHTQRRWLYARQARPALYNHSVQSHMYTSPI